MSITKFSSFALFGVLGLSGMAHAWESESLVISPSAMVYEAFEVSAVDITDGRVGATTLAKNQFGLICEKVTPVVPRPVSSYSCSLGIEGRDDAAMYHALSLRAGVIDSPSVPPGYSRTIKGAGSFRCAMDQRMDGNGAPFYHCSVD